MHQGGAVMVEAAEMAGIELPDLVPPEPSVAQVADSTGQNSFPKVLRRRLDRYFAEGGVSPKANGAAHRATMAAPAGQDS